MRGKLLVALIAALLITVAPVASASAHAFPDRSLPAVGGTVTQSPPEIRIWFTQKLEPAFSTIEVFDASGSRVDQGNSSVDAQDPSVLLVSLKPLGAGTYKVTWHVVSVDTHATEGNFSFTVKP